MKPFDFRPLGKVFGAEVIGVDLAQTLDAETQAALGEAIARHAVLVFRDQPIDDRAQVRFSEIFGELERPLGFDQYGGVHPRVTRLANVAEDGSVMAPDAHHATYLKGNQLWHTDSSFKPVPAKFSLLHARVVPEVGGETEFADCRAAYDEWPGASDGAPREVLGDLVCEHSIVYSRSLIIGDFFSDEEKAAMPAVHQRLLRRNLTTGRRSLYAGAHCSHVVDWPVERGRALIGEINAHCVQPRFVYVHRWREGDLVMWDNRSVLHRGRPHDPSAPRVMHRTTVAGDGPTLQELT